MKKYILFTASFVMLLSCQADSFFISSTIVANDINGIEFLLNGRPFNEIHIGTGRYSSEMPVSECIKAGRNTLAIKAVETATEDAGNTEQSLGDDNAYAVVKLEMYKKEGKEIVETVQLVKETFKTFSTNIVFTVPESWPIKKLDWEGETSKLTEKDKVEIKKLLDDCVDAAQTMDKNFDSYWNLRQKVFEQEGLLKGFFHNQYKSMIENEVPLYFNGNFATQKAENTPIQFNCITGANLVKISANNGPYGNRPILMFRKNMQSFVVGPEWFSKIDGKWWIVP